MAAQDLGSDTEFGALDAPDVDESSLDLLELGRNGKSSYERPRVGPLPAAGPYRSWRETLLARRRQLVRVFQAGARARERAERARAYIDVLDDALRGEAGLGPGAASHGETLAVLEQAVGSRARGADGAPPRARRPVRVLHVGIAGSVAFLLLVIATDAGMYVQALTDQMFETMATRHHLTRLDARVRALEAHPAQRSTPAVAQAREPEPEPDVPAARAPVTGDDIARHVRSVGHDTWQIDRSLLDALIAATSLTPSELRVMPQERDGRVVGLRLYGVHAGTLLSALGFENGDVLRAVDGLDVATPEHALEAYARFRDTPIHAVVLERHGHPLIHVVEIVDDAPLGPTRRRTG